jgi:hypothetical protein
MPAILTPDQIKVVAARQGIDPRLLHGLAAVESKKSGFLPDGRLKILFERHILWHRLRDIRGIDPLPLHQARPDLCDLHSTPERGYGSEAHQWVRVQNVLAWAQANAADQFESYKKATYEACSWGKFQLLGCNYVAAGFNDVYSLVHSLETGEAAHLDAAIHFMRHDGMLQLLISRQYLPFSRRWNGPGKPEEYAAALKQAVDGAKV